MSIDNNNMNNKLQTLDKLLKNHDWFYQYSDDYSVYECGDRESNTINEANDLGNVLADEIENSSPSYLNSLEQDKLRLEEEVKNNPEDLEIQADLKGAGFGKEADDLYDKYLPEPLKF